VISREHAQLSLVQNPKVCSPDKPHSPPGCHCILTTNAQSVSLTDIGSMHGTKVDGRQLAEMEIHKIASDQTVTFGSEITRNPG